MTDWTDKLNQKERAEWEEIIRHGEDELAPKMKNSAFMLSLVTADDKPDIKFCLELGMAIMLDKPIMAVVLDGAAVPPQLAKIAAEIVRLPRDAGLSTPESRSAASRLIGDAITRMKLNDE